MGAPTKRKGDVAELMVAADLVRRGFQVAFPYGEDSDFDLVLCRDGVRFERVQVKYASSDGQVISVRCRSHSLTNGKIRTTKRYSAATIDWLAVWDETLDRCFYVPATGLGSGMNEIRLRLSPARNGQSLGIRWAERYADL